MGEAGSGTLSRRAALGGALALALGPALGCTVDKDPFKPDPADPAVPDTGPPGLDNLDPGTTAAIAAALQAIVGHRGWLEALTTNYPRIEARALLLVDMHLAHQALLAGLLGGADDPAAPGTAPLPATRRDLGPAVVESLVAHEATLTDLALAARDPALARALASIGAATAQRASATGWGGPAREGGLPTEPGLMAAPQQAVWQRVLQREHASLWWYGVLGARTSASREPDLFAQIGAGYRNHRTQRDQLDAYLRGNAVEPVAAEPAYPLAWPTRTAQQRAQAARTIEHDAAATYSWLVAQLGGAEAATPGAPERLWAITALRNAAIRELVGQGIPENFPGANEIADR